MSRTEFVTITAIILFGTFLLGWLAGWIIRRLSRPARSDMTDLDHMAHQLHQAIAVRERVTASLAAREADLIAVEAQLKSTTDDLRDSRTEAEELRGYIEVMLERR